MRTKLTVIVDNISSEEISGEWGLCVLVEFGDKKILVDAGASDLFLTNMEKLGIDVDSIAFGILSHAHYDHANGIPAFFDHNSHAKFYLRDSVSDNCYHKKFIFKKYIGIPRNLIRNYKDRIEMVSGDYKIADGVYLIPHKTADLSAAGKRELMYRKTKKGWVPDDFSHEQSLVLETEKGLLIINSCSHGGAANIINEIKETFPDKHVYGLVGGFHLFNKTDEEITELAQKIKATGIDYVCTGHCTKGHAYGILKRELGDIANQMKVGYQMEF